MFITVPARGLPVDAVVAVGSCLRGRPGRHSFYKLFRLIVNIDAAIRIEASGEASVVNNEFLFLRCCGALIPTSARWTHIQTYACGAILSFLDLDNTILDFGMCGKFISR